jgi:hypothetical protein
MGSNSSPYKRKITAVLKRPKSKDPLIVYYRGIYDSMKADSTYSGSAAKLTQFDSELTDFLDAQTGFKANPRTHSKEQRQECEDKCYLTSEDLRMDVQKLANATPSKSESIITGANMLVKIIKVRIPQQNAWEYGDESGTLLFWAAGRGAHEWQSSDDGEHWDNDGATNIARKTYTGETPGTVRHFRNRQILTRGKYGDWSNPWEITII